MKTLLSTLLLLPVSFCLAQETQTKPKVEKHQHHNYSKPAESFITTIGFHYSNGLPAGDLSFGHGTLDGWATGYIYTQTTAGTEFLSNNGHLVIAPKASVTLNILIVSFQLALLDYTDFSAGNSLKIRPSVGLSFGQFDISYGYTAALTHKNFVPVTNTLSLRWNICRKGMWRQYL